MTLRPIEFNGMLQRTDDVSQLKHHEDSKPLVDQQNIQKLVDDQADAMQHAVVNKDESSGAENHADARDEGHGLYFDNRKKKEKKKKEQTDGCVIRKQPTTSFDIKI